MTTTPHTFLLGAEGCSEAEGLSWVREATPQETDALVLRILAPYQGADPAPRASDLFVDKTGRPYWAMALLPEAPPDVWARLGTAQRAVHLYP
jgi:hypothetical protein